MTLLSTLPNEIQDEITRLSERYGQPLIRSIDLGENKYFDPLDKTDRYGEVCMVVRRRNGRLLTMIKTFYPQGAYRLLTGGINHGEYVFDALLRETQEETGLEVEVKQFLAIASYHLEKSDTPVFYTFAFLLDEVSGTLGAIDEDEQVEAFREIEISELPTLAQNLEALGSSKEEFIYWRWSDWGQFRAPIHQLVWEALTTQK
ncbi:NUDIX hydrolase [Tengunoibacter tsumagoiensis]|uniref:NUDIX hydrolase n=1 Tax=Tengunoibacter tsumagoiensis TaxID=2014871 RepID=A0A402A2I9_9CHLR|nr:NUDIX hydrolase [Tengunoibacter tsumagoiensis]GCE13360.1 NUDIX hydrolase [Tengunoibacter tsumagoiensis]